MGNKTNVSMCWNRLGQGWQGSTWPPTAEAAEKQPGVTEVVLKGVTKEADRRKRKVVLFTDQAGRQTVKMRFRTTEHLDKYEFKCK